MKRDIREILFLQYENDVESGPPTEHDDMLCRVLSVVDNQTFDIILRAVADVINEQMKNAFMAGFDSGIDICRMTIPESVAS